MLLKFCFTVQDAGPTLQLQFDQRSLIDGTNWDDIWSTSAAGVLLRESDYLERGFGEIFRESISVSCASPQCDCHESFMTLPSV